MVDSCRASSPCTEIIIGSYLRRDLAVRDTFLREEAVVSRKKTLQGAGSGLLSESEQHRATYSLQRTTITRARQRLTPHRLPVETQDWLGLRTCNEEPSKWKIIGRPSSGPQRFEQLVFVLLPFVFPLDQRAWTLDTLRQQRPRTIEKSCQ